MSQACDSQTPDADAITGDTEVALAKVPHKYSDRVFHHLDGDRPRCNPCRGNGSKTMPLERAKRLYGDLRPCRACYEDDWRRGASHTVNCPFCDAEVASNSLPDHLRYDCEEKP